MTPMSNCPTPPSRRRGARLLLPLLASVLFAGCSTVPVVKETRPVWPAPPQTARIEYLRSFASDQDFKHEATFKESLTELLSGTKPPPNHVGEPMGIAVSDDGQRIYVADYALPEILVFDVGTSKLRKVIGRDPLVRPFGIALDAQENLYVVEQERKLIDVFDRSGKLLRQFSDPSLSRPEGIAIDRARGRVYVVDTSHTKVGEHNVKIFDPDGKLLGTLGKGKGTEPGQMLFPTYVSVDGDGNVYVTDTLNSRVQKFDVDGNYVRSYGSRGSAWGMFDKPKGVAVDGFGNVYVVDSGWSNVQIFNQQGGVLLFFGGSGRNPGLMWAPTAIAIDSRNRIYVADHTNRRIGVYQLVNTTAADSVPSVPAATPGPTPTPDPAQ